MTEPNNIVVDEDENLEEDPTPQQRGSARKRKAEEISNDDSTRRSAVAHLQHELPPLLKNLVETNSRKSINNIKKVNSVPQETRSLKLEDPSMEQNKQLALSILQAVEKSTERRKRIKTVEGQKLTGKSSLTYKGKESTQKALGEFISESGQREMIYPINNYLGQASSTKGEVVAINPGLKVGSQTLQLLGHLSQLFMNKVSDLEYQSMLVNDRLFVAANDRAKIQKFKDNILQDFLEQAAKEVVAESSEGTSGKLRAYKIGALGEALKVDENTDTELTQQLKDGASMMTEIEVGHHVNYDSRDSIQSILNLLQQQARNAMKMHGPVSPENAAALVDNDEFNQAVILVASETKTGWHAEQSLAYMLILSGWGGTAAVGGTKNPCFTCWLSLSLLPMCGRQLEYLTTPGFYWGTNTGPGLAAIAKQLNIGKASELVEYFDLAKTLTGEQFRQFVTALESQDDLEVDLGNFAENVKQGRLTQAQSQKSFYFGQMVEEHVEIRDDNYPPTPGSPYGTWGSPLHPSMMLDDEEAETGTDMPITKKEDD